MRRTLVLGVTLVTLAVLAWAAFKPSRAQETQSVGPGASLGPRATLYANEEQWIAGETAFAVVEMARHARGLSLTPPEIVGASDEPSRGDGAVRLAFSDAPVVLVPQPFAWAPATYRDLATATLAGTGGTSSDPDLTLIGALLHPDADTLRTENLRVSELLGRDFANPGHHESAALLLAALGLREASGPFFDVRRALGRMTAHLALADALRGSESRSVQGRLAEAALLALVGRQRDAVDRLDTLRTSTTDPAVAAWTRALRMRATLDWRLVHAVASPSLLERLEHVSAAARTTRVYADFGRDDSDTLDEAWRRLEVPFSVGDGNRLAMSTWTRTYADAALALNLDFTVNVPARLVEALHRRPAASCVIRTGDAVAIAVIDDGLLASFYERHVAFASERLLHHVARNQGSKQGADEVRTMLETALPGLTLLPAVLRRWAADADQYRTSMAALTELVARDPSRLTFDNWARAARWPPRGLAPITTLAQESAWYGRRFPTGTFYDPQRLALLWPQDAEVERSVDGLAKLAPWHVDVVRKRTYVRCKGRCTEAQLLELYGPVAEYVSEFGLALAHASGDRAPERLRGLCDRDAEFCWSLANWLVSRDRSAEAAAAFEEYIGRSKDAVAVSTRVAWLEQYYREQGRMADALRVAEEASSVGSRSGFEILATHLEHAGRIEEALALYRRIHERYDNGENLLGFYRRQARRIGHEPQESEYRQLVARYFPQGFRPVVLGELTGPPASGLCLMSALYFQQKVGFREGDVVVAADGIAIATREQWNVAWYSSFEHEMRVTIWRDGKYLDITAPFRKYQYGLDLGTYTPPATAAHGDSQSTLDRSR